MFTMPERSVIRSNAHAGYMRNLQTSFQVCASANIQIHAQACGAVHHVDAVLVKSGGGGSNANSRNSFNLLAVISNHKRERPLRPFGSAIFPTKCIVRMPRTFCKHANI